MTKSRPHEEAKLASFRQDPEYASEYLNAVLEDGDQEELLETLRYMSQAFGVSSLAGETDLNATTLYRTLSNKGNPELKTLTSILRAMGMRLAVKPLQDPSHRTHAETCHAETLR